MKKWKISEAKGQITQLLAACEAEPQMICNRDVPVGVVIKPQLFEQLMSLKNSAEIPTIKQLLAELEVIKKQEPEEIEIPPRTNRTTPLEEISV